MEHCDFAAIEALLRRHGFHFSKSMGQNFLIDATIPAAIAADLTGFLVAAALVRWIWGT